MTASPHIVVVEDDPVTRVTLASYMTAQGYRVSEAEDAEQMEAIFSAGEPDLLIVDINLDGKDGLEITREIRAASEIGIILLSGRTDDVDRIVGLELGADDYVSKPFNRRELLARVKNLLRRTSVMRLHARKLLRFDGWLFDLASRQLTSRENQPVALTRAEYEMLKAFVSHPGEVMTREALMRGVTHRNEGAQDRTVDVLVRRLRSKLERDPRHPQIISTSHGEGYVFTAALE